MTWDRGLKISNVVFPLIGIGLMVFYEVCDTACSSLRGSFLGVDLKVIGIIFMAALLALTLPPVTRYAAIVSHLRTMMLAGALGGEVILVRFQLVQDIFCSFCLAFGLCVVVLFAANLTKMNRYLALAAFLAGIAAFALFFKGSILPLYS
ncbi:MAG: hypothetical protein U1C55_01490 [Smithellaceae bacterium]|nr:hypothetical protein [Smithellaceae bacterium]